MLLAETGEILFTQSRVMTRSEHRGVNQVQGIIHPL